MIVSNSREASKLQQGLQQHQGQKQQQKLKTGILTKIHMTSLQVVTNLSASEAEYHRQNTPWDLRLREPAQISVDEVPGWFL